ncbi:MAG: DUF4276 family protein [Bacteroidota bacterium]|nr:DUF4276 family protein [Bacteroidota bacterium]
MVVVSVYFEGGADPRENPNVSTIENTARLRESFNKLLNSGIKQNTIRIEAIPAYSITNAVKIRKNNSLLLIDLDGFSSLKEKRLVDNNLIDIREFVFFMVQMMEAWILSQPDKIEKCFAHLTKSQNLLKDDPLICGIEPERILSPDRALKTLLSRYFKYRKGDCIKKLKYEKLKIAPDLIELLDIRELYDTFIDVKTLIDKINNDFS